MLETIIKGGSMMAPLMLQSVLAVAVVIDRWIAFSRNDKVDSRSLRSKVLELLAGGKVVEAMSLCASTPGPVSAVMLAGLQAYAKFARVTAGRPEICRALVEDAMENYSQVASSALNKRLGVLSFVAGSAPLLGMLGTVTGMISAFAGMAATAKHLHAGKKEESTKDPDDPLKALNQRSADQDHDAAQYQREEDAPHQRKLLQLLRRLERSKDQREDEDVVNG